MAPRQKSVAVSKLDGDFIGGRGGNSSQLPATEMRAAIDVQDVTSDRCSVGQVHDRICDVLDRRRPTIGDRLSITSFGVSR